MSVALPTFARTKAKGASLLVGTRLPVGIYARVSTATGQQSPEMQLRELQTLERPRDH